MAAAFSRSLSFTLACFATSASFRASASLASASSDIGLLARGGTFVTTGTGDGVIWGSRGDESVSTGTCASASIGGTDICVSIVASIKINGRRTFSFWAVAFPPYK